MCGLTAAYAWGLPLPPGHANDLALRTVHMTPLESSRASRRAGTSGHEISLPPDHLSMIRGSRVTSPARTWVDCAALLDPRHLLAMGDAIMRQGLASTEDIHKVMTWAWRRRGVRAARRCLPLLDGKAESPPESWIRWHMHEEGLPAPDVNYEVVVRGERVFRLDLAYRLLRIGIEYDGDWHAGTREHDVDRRNALMSHGWKIIVAHKEDLDDPPVLIARIRDEISSRRPRPRRW